MSRYYELSEGANRHGPNGKRKMNPWLKALIIIASVIVGLAIIAACVLWGLMYHYNPAHIARLIEEKSSEYLRADVKIGELDYKIFSTYPWLQFEVDSLSIISRSLDGLPASQRDSLPPDADFLASVVKIKGKINVHSLLHDKINIKDVEIDRPKVNLVMVNDTTANYLIAPSDLKMPSKIPEFKISEVNVGAPVDISFFSLQEDMEGALAIDNFYLAIEDDHKYNIGFQGVAQGRYHEYNLPGDLPLKFDAGVTPKVNDMAISLENLKLSVAGVALESNGKIIAHKKGLDIRDAQFNVKIENIFTLLNYLPEQLEQFIKIPEGLSGVLPLNVNASLLSPYHIDFQDMPEFSLETLPAMTATVYIDDANLLLAPPGKERIYADDIYFLAEASFDPQNPEATNLDVKELRLNGEGIAFSAEATVENLLGETQPIEGGMQFSSHLLETLSYILPNNKLKVGGYVKGTVEFSGNAQNLGKDGFKDMAFSGDLTSHSLKVNSPAAGNVIMKNVKSDFSAKVPQYPLNDYSGTKLDFQFSADSLSLAAKGNSVKAGQILFRIDAMDTLSRNPDPEGLLEVKVGKLNYAGGGTVFNASGFVMNANGNLVSSSPSSYRTVPLTTGVDDAIIESRVSHTPMLLEYEGGGILQTFLNMVNINGVIRLAEGYLKTASYLYPFEFSGIDLSTNLNDAAVRASEVKISDTSFSLSAAVQGLKAFLTSYSATPLKAEADINFTNVDINRLSWGYYGALFASGAKDPYYLAPVKPYTASDSVCVAIPRNIEAMVKLHSNSAQYMEYNFSPLSTAIIVKDGNATLSKLTVGTPYCTAVVDWTYATHSLNDIYMTLDAQIKNFSFTPFYKVFPSLVAKAPELQNLTGTINADIRCNFGMFPDMFMNAESLAGKFEIKGSDFEFERTGKIERITHLMLIEGDAPISIRNFAITGAYHDNILQLNPFKISFDDYQLGIAGINNTSGDMYYHLALEKSPFHMPFGVSLSGKFKHPEVRLGGTHINDYKAEMVTTGNESKIDVNIMAWLRNGWFLFLQEAAKYQQSLATRRESAITESNNKK